MYNPEDELDDELDPDFDEEESEDEEEECEEESENLEDEASPVREDKIFNNRYNTGEGLPDDYHFTSSITVNEDYSSEFLKDVYEYEEQLESKLVLDRIFEFVKTDPHISKILKLDGIKKTGTAKPKFTKEQINYIFNRVLKELEKLSIENRFFNPIYILEVISSISSLEYRKLFDMLDTDIQELLLIELNKKYQFLEGKMHKKKIH